MKSYLRSRISFLSLLIVIVMQCSQPDQYEVIIKGGMVVDGLGNPADEVKDIGIKWGRVEAIGDLSSASANRVIDAQGMYVSPGFIDIHSKSNYDILANRTAVSKIQQGITTIILGEDLSPGPVFGNAIEHAQRRLAPYGLTLNWRTLGEFFDVLRSAGVSVNVGSFVGAWQIHGSVIDFTNKRQTGGDYANIGINVVHALNEGALGISIGFTGLAEKYLSEPEFVSLFGYYFDKYGGILSVRLRAEDNVHNSLQELPFILNVIPEVNIPVEIMELKYTNSNNGGQGRKFLNAIESLREQDPRYTANIIPFPLYFSTLSDVIPLKFKEKGWNTLLTRLHDKNQLRIIENEMLKNAESWDTLQDYWKHIRIVEVFDNSNKQYIGKTLYEVTQGSFQPMDAIASLLLSEPVDVVVQIETLDEDFIKEALKKPWVKIGSGAPIINGFTDESRGTYSLLSYAAFPGALAKYVRDESVLSIEDMIKKMTSMNADRLSIPDRGRIIEGLWADIVVFDLAAISSTASTMVDEQYDTGVRYVLVNGTVVYDDGIHTGRTPGEILYGQGKR